MPKRGPGIADTDRARQGPFAALLGRSLEDEAALDALLFAYEGLSTRGRRGLMQAVAQDIAQPAPVLAALLSAEEEPPLRARLGELLRSAARPEGTAVLWGSLDEGGAALIHSLDGGPSEALRITWKCSEIQNIELESRPETSSSSNANPSDTARVVETLVPMVWSYVKRGAILPPGSERFAWFFSLG